MTTWTSIARAFILSIVLAGSAGGATTPAVAAPAPDHAHKLQDAIVGASRRFGIPERWIHAVVAAESAGRPWAVSRAGAIGLMQLMPATYAELRARYRLGADPFHVHDNILAGTAYLRELLDRYGPRGMLASYNAGPQRWEQHVERGRPLPGETVAYLARLEPQLSFSVDNDAGDLPRSVLPTLPIETIFATSSSTRGVTDTRPSDRPAAVREQFALQPGRRPATSEPLAQAPTTIRSGPLFVKLSRPGAVR